MQYDHYDLDAECARIRECLALGHGTLEFPLHEVAMQGGPAGAAALQRHLDLRCDHVQVNGRNHQSSTPLHVAAQWGRVECVELLLAAGADPHLVDGAMMLPVQLAAQHDWRPHKECAALLMEAMRQHSLTPVRGNSSELTFGSGSTGSGGGRLARIPHSADSKEGSSLLFGAFADRAASVLPAEDLQYWSGQRQLMQPPERGKADGSGNGSSSTDSSSMAVEADGPALGSSSVRGMKRPPDSEAGPVGRESAVGTLPGASMGDLGSADASAKRPRLWSGDSATQQ